MKYLGLLLLLAGLFSCSTDVKINAEPKDITIVYGVLNPNIETQYIRVAKGYLIDGDAVQYASNTDLSLSQAQVTLSEYILKKNGNKITATFSKTITLVPDQITKEPGEFNQAQTVFKTQAGDKILPGRHYILQVTVPDNPSFNTTAHTTIPSEPYIFTPSIKTPSVGFDSVYNVINFNRDYEAKFSKGRKNINNFDEYETYGTGFEMRIFQKYGISTSLGDTTWQPELQFGPTEAFDKTSCAVASNSMCYRLGGMAFVNFLQSRLTDNAKEYVYTDFPTCESTRMEITAIDTFMFNYLLVNNPKYTDFNTIKPEYTNLSGSAYGIFGSINTCSRFVRLGDCTKHIAQLNNTPKPNTVCP